MAMVKFETSDGTLSGSITFVIICIGVAPMLCAVSMMLGLTSRRLLSTRRATNGAAAITSGTIVATVPTTVPTMSLVRGNTRIISIRNGIERSKLIITFIMLKTGLGSGSTPSFSPVTIRTPKGSPITIAKNVDKTVT